MIFIPFLVIDDRFQHSHGHGNDDAAARDDLAAFQDSAVCTGRWVESGGSFFVGQLLLGDEHA